MGASRRLRFPATSRSGEVSALLEVPADARALFVLAHGAGAPMDHPSLTDVAARLGEVGIATFRYQFPYMEAGGRRPDPSPVLEATVRSAVARAISEVPGIPVLAGGRSMGGRMTSQAQARSPLAGVRGLIFLAFPLHEAGKPANARGEHLKSIGIPMLFLQGTRDALADLALVRPLCEALGQRATFHVLEGADHSFHVLKRSGRTDPEVMDEVISVIDGWVPRVVGMG